MGWGEKLPSGDYRAVWRDAQGKRRYHAGFKSKAAAKRYAGEQEGKSRRGEITDPTGRIPTWDEWCGEWLALRRVEPRTRDEDGRRIRKHIAPRWGSVRLTAIRRDDVQAWVNEMEDSGMAAGTVARIYHTFSASMKAALISGKIVANPCSLVQLPTIAQAHERFFTRGEFDKACYYLDEPWRTAVIILVGTGLRVSELAGLHWDRVDLQAKTLMVAATWDGDHGQIKPYPKSKKPRPVPFPLFVAEALEARRAASGYRVGEGCGLPHRGTTVPCRSSLVVTDPDGTPLDRRVLLRGHWKPALRQAGVQPGRVHDLRHTWASWLRQQGVDLQVVQELAGHASSVTTMRYSHFGSTAHATVRDALDRIG